MSALHAIQSADREKRMADPIGSIVRDVLEMGDDIDPVLLKELNSLPEQDRDEVARRVEEELNDEAT